MTESVNQVGLGQDEYMKLFMQELTYQDPLKPIDNREFMAQMAQFSALQQATDTADYLKQIMMMNYGDRGIGLIGKDVQVMGAEGYGSVKAIKFNAKEMPTVRVQLDNGSTLWVEMDKIVEVLPKRSKNDEYLL